MPNNREAKLCPNCPLGKAWIDIAIKRIKERQYTTEKEEPTPLKICIELRTIVKELGVEPCPYYPETESITYHTDPEVKARIDEQTEKKKRENLTHFMSKTGKS